MAQAAEGASGARPLTPAPGEASLCRLYSSSMRPQGAFSLVSGAAPACGGRCRLKDGLNSSAGKRKYFAHWLRRSHAHAHAHAHSPTLMLKKSASHCQPHESPPHTCRSGHTEIRDLSRHAEIWAVVKGRPQKTRGRGKLLLRLLTEPIGARGCYVRPAGSPSFWEALDFPPIPHVAPTRSARCECFVGAA